MKTEVRGRLAMGESAISFCQGKPHDNALYNEALAGADAALTAAKAKYGEWIAGMGTEHISTKSIDHFRDWIRTQFRKVIRVAEAISRKEPGFHLRFRLPKDRTADLKLIAELRAMVTAGEASQDAFLRYGLAPGFFATMREEIDRFEDLLTERKAGQAGHVGAAVVLQDLIDELMGHIDDLDAINTVRFAEDPEQMAAWKSASRKPSRRKARSEASKAQAAEARAAKG